MNRFCRSGGAILASFAVASGVVPARAAAGACDTAAAALKATQEAYQAYGKNPPAKPDIGWITEGGRLREELVEKAEALRACHKSNGLEIPQIPPIPPIQPELPKPVPDPDEEKRRQRPPTESTLPKTPPDKFDPVIIPKPNTTPPDEFEKQVRDAYKEALKSGKQVTEDLRKHIPAAAQATYTTAIVGGAVVAGVACAAGGCAALAALTPAGAGAAAVITPIVRAAPVAPAAVSGMTNLMGRLAPVANQAASAAGKR